MRTFCESGGGKSAKRDLSVAVVLPRNFTQGFYPLGFIITLELASLVSTPSAFINKTGVQYCFHSRLIVCLSVCVCVAISF